MEMIAFNWETTKSSENEGDVQVWKPSLNGTYCSDGKLFFLFYASVIHPALSWVLYK